MTGIRRVVCARTLVVALAALGLATCRDPVTVRHVEERRASGIVDPPVGSDPKPATDDYRMQVDRTYSELRGYSPAVLQKALEDAQFNALQTLAMQVAGYMTGHEPANRRRLVDGARYVGCAPAGDAGISVTAEIVLRDALTGYRSSLSAHEEDGELKQWIESTVREHGNVKLQAVGTGACVRERTTLPPGASPDGIPPGTVR